MLNIKIYFSEDGTSTRVEKDFDIYAGEYQNKLLSFYVPKSLVTSNYYFMTADDMIIVGNNNHIENYEDTGDSSINLTAVQFARKYVARDGSISYSGTFYARYNKELTIGGKEYVLFSRTLPYEMTLNDTSECVENIMTVNVLNITRSPIYEDDTIVGYKNTAFRIATTQELSLPIYPSKYLDGEPVDDASEYSAVINEILEDIDQLKDFQDTKQDKVDPAISIEGVLEHAEHKVVNSINALNTQVGENVSAIDSQAESISDLSERIGNVERQVTPIGQMDLTALPTDAQVSAYVTSVTGEEPQLNDSVIVVVNDDGVITTYRYLYTVSGWTHTQIEYQQKAENDVAGLVEGTEGITGYNQPISANIVNGQIINIKYKDNNGDYQQVGSTIDANKTNITNIINGTQVVGEATKATEDSNGDNIAQTYAKAANVYTKSQSDMKYLPKTYTDVYYYAADGLVDNVPTTPADGVQFTANIPQTGEVELASCGRTLTANYHFTKNSTDESRIWLMTDTNTTLQIRLLTYVTSGENTELLASQLTSDIEFVANEPQEVILDSIYNNLGNIEIDVEAGETFTKVIYVTSTSNTASTIELISSLQYASSFNLAVQSISFDVNMISGIKVINIASTDWTANLDGSYSVTIAQTQHQQAPTNRYFLTLQQEISTGVYDYIVFTPQVDSDGNITITSDEALSCQLLIASATKSETRGMLTATNPTSLPTIDYEQSGALRILQTETATPLTLNVPQDTGKFYTFFVANDNASTETISVNGQTIEVGSGVQFKWVGEWQTGITPTDTAEIYDSVNAQPLNTTITQLETGKQDALTAGSNISISAENVISATDTTYTAGTNISISNENVISASQPDVSKFELLTGINAPTTSTVGAVGQFYLDAMRNDLYQCLAINDLGDDTLSYSWLLVGGNGKQDKLTAGTGISISGNVISATGGVVGYNLTLTNSDRAAVRIIKTDNSITLSNATTISETNVKSIFILSTAIFTITDGTTRQASGTLADDTDDIFGTFIDLFNNLTGTITSGGSN